MRRRQVLSAAALSAIPLAGCTGPGSSLSPGPDDPIRFVVDNNTDSQRTVNLTLTEGDRTLLEESVTLAAGDSKSYDPGIGSPAEYELSVAVESGPNRSLTLDIEAFDVNQGSDHFIDITPDGIDIYWEE